MSVQYLFDTDHLTLWDQGDVKVVQRLAIEPVGTVALSIITVEEYLRGRLAYLSRARDATSRLQGYDWLQRSVQMLNSWVVVSHDSTVEQEYQQLLSRRLRVGSQDLKIAAACLAGKLILVTRNRRDFAQIPGLVIEDWSV